MWEPEQQSSLSVRHIKPSDDPFITKIEPIPPSLESRISKYAFSIATSYFHRLNMFPDSYGNVVVDEKNEQPIGACGAGKKTVRIGGSNFLLNYCSDGIVHKDYRNQGALYMAGAGTQEFQQWFWESDGFYGCCTSEHTISRKMMEKTGFHRGTSRSYSWHTDFFHSPSHDISFKPRVQLLDNRSEKQFKEISDLFETYYSNNPNIDFVPTAFHELFSLPYFQGTFLLSHGDSFAAVSVWHRQKDFPLFYKPEKNQKTNENENKNEKEENIKKENQSEENESNEEDLRSFPYEYCMLFAPMLSGPDADFLFCELIKEISIIFRRIGISYCSARFDSSIYLNPKIGSFLEYFGYTEYVQYLSGIKKIKLGQLLNTDPLRETFWDPRDCGPVFIQIANSNPILPLLEKLASKL